MVFKLGIIILFFSVIFGYIGGGGHIFILFQPAELLIICGAAAGVFMITNTKTIQIEALRRIMKINRMFPYNKQDYISLLLFMFNIFRFAANNSLQELERHIDQPQSSNLFKKFPQIWRNHEVVVFICDYMRVLTLGFDNAYEIQRMAEEELDEKHRRLIEVSGSLTNLGDTLPALGIVAAVLGIINTLGSISADPHILGQKIAGALMGTFLGVFFAYGIMFPLGSLIMKYGTEEIKFLECIKSGIISHAKQHPPYISVEFARQMIPDHLKPTFLELEHYIQIKNGEQDASQRK
jgi:chemotaxis protein MotA